MPNSCSLTLPARTPRAFARAPLAALTALAATLVPVAGCSSSAGAVTDAGSAIDSGNAASDSGAAAQDGSPAQDGSAAQDAAGGAPKWTLTWADEFNGADGSPVDPTKWGHEIGGDGWGNMEREYYTDGASNAVQTGGNLVITATTDGAAQYTCWYGACEYTSARLITKGKFSQKYGRFEARIKIPSGQGLWPAWWMLGNTGRWPACGEIDIMENIGREPTIVHASLHGPGYPGEGLTGEVNLPSYAPFANDFHIYAVEWDAAAIKFYVDGALYETQTPADAPKGQWPFVQPFYLLLNVAVGGSWPGDPDATSKFPQTMQVDYVRVYQKM